MSPRMLLIPVFALSILGSHANAGDDPPLISDSLVFEPWAIPRPDGTIQAQAPGYKASFDTHGFTLHPALGRQAPRSYPLSFHLDSIWRGSELVYRPMGNITPRVLGGCVVYEHTATIVERYELRDRGIEQSFVFDSLPAGTGDLVVRGRLDTDLVPMDRADDAEALRFEAAGIGAIDFGGVTGIDAESDRARGNLRHEGDVLELVLPGAFVGRAAFPLVLDPLIGPHYINGFGGDNIHVDVAYDLTNHVYLVVWNRFISNQDGDILARRISPLPSVAPGPLMALESSTVDARNAKVANVNLTNRFLVAWIQGSRVHVLSVDPATDTASPDTTLNPVVNVGNPIDLGGEQRLASAFDKAVLVYQRGGASGVFAQWITVPVSGAPRAHGGEVTVSTGPDANPSVSQSGGSFGRWLVVWERHVGPFGEGDIYGKVLAGLLACTPEAAIVSNSGPDEARPRCDGDGTEFLVAWERAATAGLLSRDVRCKKVTVTGSCAFPPSAALSFGRREEVVDGNATRDETEPVVALAGSRYLVVWARAQVSGAIRNLHGTTLDVATLGRCEPKQLVDPNTGNDSHAPAIASQQSGGRASDHALATWLADAISGVTSWKAQRMEAMGAGGLVQNLGGGCGRGGTLFTGGPVAVGNTDFFFTLGGADAAATRSWLILGPGAPPITCGPCTIKPPFSFLPVPISGGAATQSIPIPCDTGFAGVTLEAQMWAYPTTVNPCSLLPGLSVSNRLAVTIGY